MVITTYYDIIRLTIFLRYQAWKRLIQKNDRRELRITRRVVVAGGIAGGKKQKILDIRAKKIYTTFCGR